ncbi:MAG: molybdopterin biosynthesis protein MoeB, partial [Acidobacteria bacterium]|nr:molybdopterin biosynthesis protein MoeB [Acidobacteriota bacterium]
MATYREIVEAARGEIEEITPAQVMKRLNKIVLIDVREADEHQQGAIPEARFLARGVLERDIATVVIDRKDELVLYCSGGSRSALAAAALKQMGYERVVSMAGGFDRWKAEGLPWGDPTGLTADQRTRYARHVRLPE